jgi:excisionase family DNA binding protein
VNPAEQVEGFPPHPRNLLPVTDAIVWMSTAEVADYLGIGARTLYRLIDQGELPAYKFGRVIRLQQREVDQYIARVRIQQGELKHLYPEPRPDSDEG